MNCKMQQGYTLIELMVVVALLGVLATLGIAGYNTLVKRNVVAEAANTLNSSINVGRSEAISRNTRVTLCKSANGTSCTTAGQWDQGWIVFLDVGDGLTSGTVGVRDSGEELIQRYSRLHAGLSIRGQGAAANYISFLGSGIPRKADDGFLDESTEYFVLCMNNLVDMHTRALRISKSGRVANLAREQANISTCG